LDHLRKFGRLCETCGKQKAAEKENFFHVGIQKKGWKKDAAEISTINRKLS
jgi:hypothetical protein